MAKALADIRTLARAHTAGAIKTLAGIMHQKDAPAAARVAAAQALLDRGWGKAPLMLESESQAFTLIITGVPRDEDDNGGSAPLVIEHEPRALIDVTPIEDAIKTEDKSDT